MSEIYFSVDIETNGWIPGEYSMLSLGAVAFSEEGLILDKFFVNLKPLEGAKENPSTMEWWSHNKAAYIKATENPLHPRDAMVKFKNWVEVTALESDPVCVAYPAGFDFTFIYWYLIKFAGYSPFGFSCIDMKSYAMRTLKMPYRKTIKRNMPKSWFDSKLAHSHVSVEDAEEQGRTFIKMLKEPCWMEK